MKAKRGEKRQRRREGGRKRQDGQRGRVNMFRK